MAISRTRSNVSRRHDPTRLGARLKKRLRAGELLLGGMLFEYLRPSIVKLYQHAGFDFIYIDNEHATFLGPEFTDTVLSARDNELPVICKVGQLERAETARLLEAGVTGIQLPRTESREQLLELIDYMRFPPKGTRAAAPCFGNVDYIGPDNPKAWLKKADQTTLLVVHIETALAYENADEIISTPGVDMVYVGPYDFSVSMGQPGDYDHPDVRRPMREILKICQKHRVPFGTTASSPAAGARWVREGCQFFEVVDELSLIRQGAADAVRAYEKLR